MQNIKEEEIKTMLNKIETVISMIEKLEEENSVSEELLVFIDATLEPLIVDAESVISFNESPEKYRQSIIDGQKQANKLIRRPIKVHELSINYIKDCILFNVKHVHEELDKLIHDIELINTPTFTKTELYLEHQELQAYLLEQN